MKNGSNAFFNNTVEASVFPNCYSLYSGTNENLGYFKRFADFEDKDVLTVTASGDQALNAILFGAKSVETFDINLLAFYFYELKEKAVENLSREEFLDFYCNFPLFDKKIYNKFSGKLGRNTKMFFDHIFSFLESESKFKNYHLGNLIENYEDFRNPDIMVFNNPYLRSKTAFNETKRRIASLKQPVRHKFCPAHKLDEYFGKKDIVILSNILQYYFYEFYADPEYNGMRANSEKARNFLQSLLNVLNDEGKVSLAYDFSTKFMDDDQCKRRLGVETEKIYINRHNRNAFDVATVTTKNDISDAIKNFR